MIESDVWQRSFPQAEAVARQAIALIGEESLSLVLADDGFIQTLNNQFRGQDKATNVLSFPSEEDGYLGDIIIAFETLEREAEEQGKTLAHHFTHMAIHGVLHLQGYDHEEDSQAERMESREIQLLQQLGIANPYETR